jgi:hypothetical protein
MAYASPFAGSTYDVSHINVAAHPLDKSGKFLTAIIPLASGAGIRAKYSEDGGTTWSSEVNVPTSGTVTGAAVWWGIRYNKRGEVEIWNEDESKSYKCVAWPAWVAN